MAFCLSKLEKVSEVVNKAQRQQLSLLFCFRSGRLAPSLLLPLWKTQDTCAGTPLHSIINWYSCFGYNLFRCCHFWQFHKLVQTLPCLSTSSNFANSTFQWWSDRRRSTLGPDSASVYQFTYSTWTTWKKNMIVPYLPVFNVNSREANPSLLAGCVQQFHQNAAESCLWCQLFSNVNLNDNIIFDIKFSQIIFGNRFSVSQSVHFFHILDQSITRHTDFQPYNLTTLRPYNLKTRAE